MESKAFYVKKDGGNLAVVCQLVVPGVGDLQKGFLG